MTKEERYAYSSWHAMNRRCNDPTSTSWKWYGSKGIKVCERWHKDNPIGFQNFLSDMGARPKFTSLDRLSHTSHYQPGNCQWIADNNRPKMSVSEAGRKGGNARAQNLSASERKRIATLGYLASPLSVKHITCQTPEISENK